MINAKALIGTILGTCTIQKFIGKGDTAGVFLAQQSPPERQVAVKIMSPTQSQLPSQRAAFSARFQREIGIVSTLNHPHILSVYEHGEQNGLSYLVMPYINGGTLNTILEPGVHLDFARILTYLEQLASALDYAHDRGIIHRNLKPANVLVNSEGQLLLTDFGVMSIVAERQTSQMRAVKAGTSIGSLDYIAPEQVMGDTVDGHADIYTLGIILYQMVTGKTPFQGTPVQVAAQHVHAEPPSPRLVRTDLPVAADQVIIRAMAKRPADRYARAQDLASAFRVALMAAGVQLETSTAEKPASQNAPISSPQPAFPTRRRGLFDPIWQQTAQATDNNASNQVAQGTYGPTNPLPPVESRDTPPAPSRLRLGLKANLIRSSSENSPMSNVREDEVARGGEIATAGARPAPTMDRQMFDDNPSLSGSATPTLDVLASTGNLPPVASASSPPAATTPQSMPPFATPDVSRAGPSPDSEKKQIPFSTDVDLGTRKTTTRLVSNPTTPVPAVSTTTGSLTPLNNAQGIPGNTVKLAGAMKVVQVPIAGQPGRYITGLLPVQPTTEETPSVEKKSTTDQLGRIKDIARNKKYQKIFAAVLVVLLIVTGSGIFLFRQAHSGSAPKDNGIHAEKVTPDLQAILSAEATATVQANTILADPLTQNIHGWPIQMSGAQIYQFVNGAYHITDNNPQQSAPALLPGFTLQEHEGYTLTMEEIRGDDSSINNSFGMILDFSSRTQGKSTIVTFYSFEVLNKHSGEYQFWKYDSSKGSSPWTKLWHQRLGGEFHQGQGPKSINTINVFVNGKTFAFTVNGKKVGSMQDGSLTNGEIGMLVNLKGTEVAFSNLELTNN